MTAVLFKQRRNVRKDYEAVTAEPTWQDVLGNWLLDNKFPMPLGKYLIVEGDTIAEVKLEKTEGGERYVTLETHLSLRHNLEVHNEKE